MKTLLGIIICSVVIISISGINHAYSLEYIKDVKNPPFKIEYPDGWDMYDEFLLENELQRGVVFYDEQNEPSSTLEIRTIADYNNNDTQFELERVFPTGLYMELKQTCESFERYTTCSNHELIYSQIVYIDEIKSYQLAYSWTMNFNDDQSVERISIVTYVPDGLTTWVINSESTSDGYSLYKEQIFSSINSFDLFPIKLESQCSDDYVSIIKYNGGNYCIYPTSFYPLLDRGWALNHNNNTGEMSLKVAEKFIISEYEGGLSDTILISFRLEITQVAESYPEKYYISANYSTTDADWIIPKNHTTNLVVSNGIVIDSKDA